MTTTRASHHLLNQHRVNKAQMEATTMENFDMKIMVGKLSEQIRQNNADKRRFSAARPTTEDFYGFNDEDVSIKPSIKPTRNYNFDNQPSGNKASAASERSPSENNYDWREVSKEEDRALAQAFMELEFNRLKNEKDTVEKRLTEALLSAVELESSVKSLTERNEKMKQELARERANVESARKSYASIAATQKNNEERGRLLQIEQIRRATAEQRASIAEKRARDLEEQRKLAVRALEDEKVRVTEWEDARRRSIGVANTVVSFDNIAAMLREMENERKCLDSREYSPNWREYVLKNWNLCLRILHLCETDVIHEKRVFISKSCGEESLSGEAYSMVTLPTSEQQYSR